MCTPSFMCKFPFSGREFVARSERVCERLAAIRRGCEAPAAGTAYAKSSPPQQQPRGQPAACDRLHAGCDARGDARRRAPLRADHRRRLHRRAGRRVPDARGAPLRRAHRLPLVRQVLGSLHARTRSRAGGDRSASCGSSSTSSRRALQRRQTSSSTARSQSTARSWRARAGAAARRSRRRPTRRVGSSRDGCAAGGRARERATLPRRFPHTARPRRSQRRLSETARARSVRRLPLCGRSERLLD